MSARRRILVPAWRHRRSPPPPAPSVRQQSHVLRPPHHQQPGRNEADDQHRGADGDPAGAPAVLLDGKVGNQRQAHQPRHLREVGDRGDEGAARHEPAVERAVDAEIERAGEVHARDAEEEVEGGERLRERQQHGGNTRDEHRQAQHEPGAAAIEHRPDQRRGQRGHHAAERAAPDSAVRVHPNSLVIGSTKIDRVATAGPWRESRPCRRKPGLPSRRRTAGGSSAGWRAVVRRAGSWRSHRDPTSV